MYCCFAWYAFVFGAVELALPEVKKSTRVASAGIKEWKRTRWRFLTPLVSVIPNSLTTSTTTGLLILKLCELLLSLLEARLRGTQSSSLSILLFFGLESMTWIGVVV